MIYNHVLQIITFVIKITNELTLVQSLSFYFQKHISNNKPCIIVNDTFAINTNNVLSIDIHLYPFNTFKDRTLVNCVNKNVNESKCKRTL